MSVVPKGNVRHLDIVAADAGVMSWGGPHHVIAFTDAAVIIGDHSILFNLQKDIEGEAFPYEEVDRIRIEQQYACFFVTVLTNGGGRFGPYVTRYPTDYRKHQGKVEIEERLQSPRWIATCATWCGGIAVLMAICAVVLSVALRLAPWMFVAAPLACWTTWCFVHFAVWATSNSEGHSSP